MTTVEHQKFKVVDLFAGAGGLSYGFFKDPDFEIVWANEYDKGIAKIYQDNHPGIPMIVDGIENLTEELLKEFDIEQIDLVIGGPPCQSYSTVGKRQMDDRANLYQEYIRMLQLLKPKAFIYENVKGLLSMEKGQLIKDIKKGFEELGYEVTQQLMNAADYGVPQTRERVILVGVLGKNNFIYPAPTHSEKPELFELLAHVTLEDAIGNLPSIKSNQSAEAYIDAPKTDYQKFIQDTTILTNHSTPQNGDNLIAIMEALPDGGTKDDLPEEIRPSSGYGNTYSKLWWHRPATTITRNFSTPSSSRCIHPRDSRPLTAREGARLQSFPDSYQFKGTKNTVNLSIGNAVPPLLSTVLTPHIKEVLIHMTIPKELLKLDTELRKHYTQYLADQGVTYPTIGNKRWYVLMCLFEHYQQAISQDDITNWFAKYEQNYDRQARHLAADGWYISSGNIRSTRMLVENGLNRTDLKLVDITQPNPIWKKERQTARDYHLTENDWNEKLELFRKKRGCSVCGRHVEHYDKGHLDPTKPLEDNNIVPMCVECNNWGQVRDAVFVLEEDTLIARPVEFRRQPKK